MLSKKEYIKISAEIELIENELEILDPNNPIESDKIQFLKNNLSDIQRLLKDKKKEERLKKFKLIKN